MKALLLTSPGCPHCESMKKVLAVLEKNAEIDAFNVVDLSKNPELAEVNNVRSVPWLKLGDDIELTGAHTIEELRQWLTSGQNEMTEALRFGQLFQNGGLDQVINEVRASPSKIHDVLKLLFVDRTKMVERIGIGALLEDLQGELDNYAIEPELKRLAGSKDHKDRVDAAYYLGLVNNLATRNVLKSLINDPHPEVAEEAKDALQ